MFLVKIPWWCISCVGDAASGGKIFEVSAWDWDPRDDFQSNGTDSFPKR